MRKRLALFSVIFVSMALRINAQVVTENHQPLTKEAKKGFIDDVKFETDGKIHVIYQDKISKKEEEVKFEDYVFGQDLKFLETKPTSVKKETKPDKETNVLGSRVGGCNSFEILSMKIRIQTKIEVLTDWNYKKQRYDKKKTKEGDVVKIKSDSGKPYYGIEDYWDDDAQKLVVLSYYETKDKANPKKYVLLTVDFGGNVQEKPLDVSGNYSVVYSQEVSETETGKSVGKQDFIVILAPKQGMPNTSEYIYLHYDLKGTLKNKITFASPVPALLVTNATVIDGSIFLFGQSRNEKGSFEKIFEDYAPMENPCYIATGSASGAGNPQMEKYNKEANEEMDNFHILRITGSKLDFATTAPIAGLKSKMKTPPSDKGATPYKGKKFSIAKFEVTPSNEYLIAGQLLGKANVGNLKHPVFVATYGDIVCLHLDAKGNLKAQYAIDRMFQTKKSEVFEMPQSFYFSGDGKSVYWEIMEAKGERDFWTGAIENVEYYPRIAKIDLEKTAIGDLKVFGNRKYFVYKSFPGTFLPDQNSLVYFGKDDDESVLWVGKTVLE